MVTLSTERWTGLLPLQKKALNPLSLCPVVSTETMDFFASRKSNENIFTWSLTSLTTLKQKAFNKKPLDLNWVFLVCQRWKDFLVTCSRKCNLLIFCRLGKQGFIYIILHLHLSYTKLRIIFLSFFSQQYSNKAFKSLLPCVIVYSWAKCMQILLLQFAICYSKTSLRVQITYKCETTEQVLDCHSGKKCST